MTLRPLHLPVAPASQVPVAPASQVPVAPASQVPVAPASQVPAARPALEPAPDPALNPTVAGLRSSAIRDLLALTLADGMLSLAGGLPSAEAFPVAELAEAVPRLLRANPAVLQYGPTEGDPRLRDWVAGYESARSGRSVPADQVLITAGSQQALDLLARTLCRPGDVVVVEEPGYLGALQAWQAAGATLRPVPVDADGLDVDRLADLLAGGLRPVAVSVVPTFQNPTGASLPVARRRQLADLARDHGFWVIEDDPYAELRFGVEPLPPIRGLSGDGGADRVVTLGSFSKTVAPGLRVGWAVLPPALMPALVRLKQAADLHAGSLGQAAVGLLVSGPGWWPRQLSSIRARYAERAVALAGALAEAFGPRLELTVPAGGMFLWGRFTDGTSAADLLPVALEHGVAFVPGVEFFTGHPDAAAVRLSFAANPPAALAEAARRLAAAHAAHTAHTAHAAGPTGRSAAGSGNGARDRG